MTCAEKGEMQHHPWMLLCTRAKSLSRVRLFVTLWTGAHQAPLSMGFSRQEYWSGLPCPPPRTLPDPGIESVSLMSPVLVGRFFTTCAIQEALDAPNHPLKYLGDCAYSTFKLFFFQTNT